jgi:hypothetical protein
MALLPPLHRRQLRQFKWRQFQLLHQFHLLLQFQLLLRTLILLPVQLWL